MDFMKKEVYIDEKKYYAVEVKLPKTTLIVVGNDIGFVMCGALNIDIYDTPKMKERKVICANAIGVKTVDDLINGVINQSTSAASEIGIKSGMSVKDALNLLS